MANNKNPGPLLTSRQLGGESSIPPEFRAAMQRIELVQEVNLASTPIPLSDTIVESRLDQTRTDEFTSHQILKVAGQLVLRDTNTNDQGQPVQLVKTMFRTGGAFVPTVSSATTSVGIRDLGNGQSIEEASTEGTYDGSGTFVPGIFDNASEEKEISEVIPGRFLPAITSTTEVINEEGTEAEAAALGDGVTGNTRTASERITQFVRKQTVTSRTPTLPVVLTTTNLSKDFFGGISTVTEKFGLTSTFSTPDFSATTLDFNQVQIDNLYSTQRLEQLDAFREVVGTDVEPNGLAVQISKSFQEAGTEGGVTSSGYTEVQPVDFLKSQVTEHVVVSLLNPVEVQKRNLEIVPQKYLAGLSVTTTTTRVATDNVTPDTLGNGITGITQASIERYSPFENRKIKEERTLTLPQTISGQKITTQFGGGILNVTDTLTSNAPASFDGGLQITDREYSQLSSGLFDEHEEILAAESWPILSGTLVDETTGVTINYTKQVVAAGTEGGIDGTLYTEVQPVDAWRSIAITSDLSTIVLPDAISYPGTYDVKEPDTYTITAVNATSGDVYSESRAHSRFAGFSGPKIVTFTEGYVLATGLAALVTGLTGRRISSGNSSAYTNSYATTGDAPYANTFASSDPTSDSVEGTVLSLRIEKLRYGIWRYILIINS